MKNLAIGIPVWLLALSVFATEVAPVMDRNSCEAPKYPKAALINEETGTVSMAFLIGTDGKVSDSRVDKSSGAKSLDKAAISALSQCKFRPGTKDGKPEAVWVKLDFVWKLE